MFFAVFDIIAYRRGVRTAHNHIHFVLINGFVFDKHAGHYVEKFLVFGQEFGCFFMRLFYDTFDLAVDKRSHTLAVIGAGLIISSHEDLVVVAVVYGSDLFAHTPLGNHFSRALGNYAYVVGRARGNILNNKFFGNSAAERHYYIV